VVFGGLQHLLHLERVTLCRQGTVCAFYGTEALMGHMEIEREGGQSEDLQDALHSRGL
jgi:hypothetical protein